MPHALAFAVEIATTVMAVAGMGYFLAALVAARLFVAERRRPHPAFSAGVSVLKSLKGIDPGMMDAFRSHCKQTYAGEYELLFGVASFDGPEAVVVARLQREFPEREIKLRQCPERLGTNGKVSTLIQLAQHARYDYLIINDSDISVSPLYLEQVMAGFAAPEVGMVTALYRGRAHETMASRFEALGIATDFQPSVLLSRLLEGGLHYGLGSTLAVRREALAKAGGLEGLVDQLADDYEMGARIAKGGYRVALSAAVVETAVPAYNWRGYIDHQLRWLRTVRDARPGGYAGLVVTYGLAWALINLIASGLSPLSLWLLALSLFLRLGLAMTVAAEVLSDHQALPSLWLLPLRDLVAIALWSAGFAGNTIVWRGERFQVKGGKLFKAS
ncbi:MAG: bacteriohopanetetrol glucosamine biosynthesis glycosyltransferase HpnI [Terracidiphilus sp.]|jgi:ceramide glucosyltransferase